MSLRDSRRTPRLCSAAAALTLLWTSAPLHAQAGVDLSGSPTASAICQVSVTVQMTSYAVSMTVPGSLAGDQPYTIGGSGNCSGLLPGPFQLQSGSGTTQVPPTCAEFLSLNGGAIAWVGPTNFAFSFDLAGPTTEGQMVMTALVGTGGAGTAVLSMTTASLQACSQPGGTTTLQYTGVAVFVFT
jgi:hypothetical protein